MPMVSGFEDLGHWPWAENTGDIGYTFDDDPLIVVNATKVMNRVNETYARLSWDIGFSYNCTEDVDSYD